MCDQDNSKIKIYKEDLRFLEIEDNLFWINNDLHILLKNNKEIVIENAYLQDVFYNLIDKNCTESITLVGNNKERIQNV